MKILITGSRDFNDVNLANEAMDWVIRRGSTVGLAPEDITIVHGGARGADSLVGYVAQEKGMNVEIFPAHWDKHGKAAGIIRNNQMIDYMLYSQFNEEAEIVLAFPVGKSRGTRHCMKAAEDATLFVINATEQ